MTDYGKVVGTFVAPVAQAGVYGEACQGHVDFVPRLTLARTQELIILPATIQCPLGQTGELTWKGEIGVDLRAPAATPDVPWTWEVHPHISFAGQSLWIEPFGIDVQADTTLDLATAVQLPVLPEGGSSDQGSTTTGHGATTITNNGDGTATIS